MNIIFYIFHISLATKHPPEASLPVTIYSTEVPKASAILTASLASGSVPTLR